MRLSRTSLCATAAGIALLATGAPALAAGAAHSSPAPTAFAGKSGKQHALKRLHTLTRPDAASERGWLRARGAARKNHDRFRFSWTTDYCTGLKDQSGGFGFRLSCARHDFGYRNYKGLIGRKAFRHSVHERRVDRAFLSDMRRQCHKETDEDRHQTCLKIAKAYYNKGS